MKKKKGQKARVVPVSTVATPEQYRFGEKHTNGYALEPDETEFIGAINAYRERYERPFPTWSEVLHIAKSLGYRKEP